MHNHIYSFMVPQIFLIKLESFFCVLLFHMGWTGLLKWSFQCFFPWLQTFCILKSEKVNNRADCIFRRRHINMYAYTTTYTPASQCTMFSFFLFIIKQKNKRELLSVWIEAAGGKCVEHRELQSAAKQQYVWLFLPTCTYSQHCCIVIFIISSTNHQFKMVFFSFFFFFNPRKNDNTVMCNPD